MGLSKQRGLMDVKPSAFAAQIFPTDSGVNSPSFETLNVGFQCNRILFQPRARSPIVT
jgi:hypothetical protein